MGTYINIGNEGFASALNGEYVDKSGLIAVINSTLNTERRFSKRQVSWDEMTLVDGCYVLKDPCFADDMKGWALVMVKGERCSSQTLVTRCTLYEKYMTDEALEAAADSYGGLTDPGFLSGG